MIRAQYTTLTSVKRQKDIPKDGPYYAPATDDARLQDAIDWASGFITDETERVFVPTLATRSYRSGDVYYGDWEYSDGLLQLDDDLLEVTALVNGTGTAIPGTAFELHPLNTYPKKEIAFIDGQGQSWQFPNRNSNVNVIGFYGYHEDYVNAWKAAGSLVGTLSSSDDTAIISDYRYYEVGDYVRLTTSGTQEIALVDAVGTVGGSLVGTLTLDRALNGTSGIAHGTATAMPRYQHVRQIQKACNDLAVFYYDNRDAKESTVEVAELAIRLENKIPGRIWSAVRWYAKPRFQATNR